MSDRTTHTRAGGRQRTKTLPFLLGTLLASIALAQPPEPTNRLHLDFTEADYPVAGGLAIPIVHLFDEPKLEECLAAGDTACADAALYRLPFIPSSKAEAAVEKLAEAYRDLRRGVAESVDAEINNGPACHSFITCLPGSIPTPVPDIGCLVPRIFEGTLKGLAEHLPRYHAEVNRIINTELIFYISSGTVVFPAVDSVLAPTMGVGEITDLLGGLASLESVDDAIAAAYRVQSLSPYLTGIAAPSIPNLANQVEYEERAGRLLALPGYRDYEEGKRSREELYDPDSVNLNAGIFGATGLRQHTATALAGSITPRVAATNASAAGAAKGVLTQQLGGLVPTDVIDELAQRVQVTVENAASGEDLSVSIARALDQGITRLAPTLYTEAATSRPLARAVGFTLAEATAEAPAFDFGTDLSVSLPLIYEHIGYVGFTQITPEDQNVTLLHWDGFEPVPGIRVKCFGFVPTPVKIPWPTRATLYEVARAAYITVPEGYEVPKTTQQLHVSPAVTLFD